MSQTLIDALRAHPPFDHPVEKIELIETHISWILLTGPYAYKIKKPVDFGFLDFSTLEKRRHFCQRELELNRRLAPAIYLEVVAIGGSEEAPRIGGEAIEYALKMRQFSPAAQFDALLGRRALRPDHIDALADRIARFHETAERAADHTPWGTPEAVAAPMVENFDTLRPLLSDPAQRQQLERLEHWTREALERLEPLLRRRRTEGFIRNGHGDMHLGNIALIDDEVVIFDCIEFNDAFRWIDTLSDLAFTAMDLDDRGRPELAARLVNRYLERSGDYQGAALLDLYRSYRAMVRAKVAALRLNQPALETAQAEAQRRQLRGYLALAERYTRPRRGALYIAHGLSGSGKSSLTLPLLERFGMIRLRSDVERKRLHGLAPEARSDGSIYGPGNSERTYARLERLAERLLEAGFEVIVDATFLKRRERDRFAALARRMAVPFTLLHFHAPRAQLEAWIEARQRRGDDPSEATVEVLAHQYQWLEPVQEGEANTLIEIDTRSPDAARRLIEAVAALTD